MPVSSNKLLFINEMGWERVKIEIEVEIIQQFTNWILQDLPPTWEKKRNKKQQNQMICKEFFSFKPEVQSSNTNSNVTSDAP